jgi:hypothetical protein
MGVSADNSDLALLVSGGEGFAQRIAELSAAKASFDKALSDLNLGKAAVAANDEAGRVLSAAKAKRDADMAALDEEVSNARSGLNIWVDETKAATMASLNDAQAALADAKAQQEAAALANKTAQGLLDKAKSDAASLVKDAQSQASDIIDKAKDQAADILKSADKTSAAAQDALDDALASKAKYDNALSAIEQIKSAVAG